MTRWLAALLAPLVPFACGTSAVDLKDAPPASLRRAAATAPDDAVPRAAMRG